MKSQIIDMLKTYFNDEDKYGQDYACSAMLQGLAELVEFDIDGYIERTSQELEVYDG